MSAHDTIAPVHEPSARSGAAYATPVDPSIAGGPPARKRRLYAPGELVSLWDMLRFNARAFVGLMRELTRLEASLAQRQREIAQQFAARSVSAQDAARLYLRNEASDEMRSLFREMQEKVDGLHTYWQVVVGRIEKACMRLRIDSALDQIPRAREAADAATGWDYGDFPSLVRDLGNRIEDALRRKTFMFVPSKKAKYFDKKQPSFGEKVRDKFPELSGDIRDASWCLGTGLPTAAVFHLMRVTEFGIRRLAKRLKVQPNKVKHKTWDRIFAEINQKIDALSKLPSLSARKREWRDRCAEAMAHLNNVRIAWRNRVMHAECDYVQNEAKDIFENVKAFTNYLADKVF